MIEQLRDFLDGESGATAIEYGLIAALVSVAGMATMRELGESMLAVFEVTSGTLDAAGEAGSG